MFTTNGMKGHRRPAHCSCPADEKSANLAGHTLTPKADGKTELSVAFGGKTVKVPVEVEKVRRLHSSAHWQVVFWALLSVYRFLW